MQLKVNKVTKNKMVTVILETVGFTLEENAMLDQLGEPVISLDKCYGSNAVKFSKKVRSGFKVKVRFDASLESDVDITAGYVDTFVEEVQTQIEDKMFDLSTEFSTDLVTSQEIKPIQY
jgi:hypothetical protein